MAMADGSPCRAVWVFRIDLSRRSRETLDTHNGLDVLVLSHRISNTIGHRTFREYLAAANIRAARITGTRFSNLFHEC